jgi:hypothetical protein
MKIVRKGDFMSAGRPSLLNVSFAVEPFRTRLRVLAVLRLMAIEFVLTRSWSDSVASPEVGHLSFDRSLFLRVCIVLIASIAVVAKRIGVLIDRGVRVHVLNDDEIQSDVDMDR